MNKRSLGVAAVLAAIALGAVVQVPAQAAASGNAVIEIKSVALRQCLQPGRVNDFDWLVLAPCSGSAAQQWELVPMRDSKLVLRNLGDRTCVNGWVGVLPTKCHAEDADQHAELVPDAAGSVKLKYGRNYADTSSYKYSGTLSAYSASDTDHQRWLVREVGETSTPVDTTGKVVSFRSFDEGTCIAENAGLASHLTCADDDRQRFQRVELGDGVFQLRNVASGTCIGKYGVYVHLRTACASDDTGQHFRLDTDELGYSLISHVGGEVLTPFSRNEVGSYRHDSGLTWQKWEVSVA